MAIKVSVLKFQSAEFADERRLGRPVKSNAVFRPDEIHLDGDKLAWSLPKVSGEGNWIHATNRIITPFLKLADAAPDAIVEFARRYGVFGACQLRPDAPKRDDDILFADERWRISTELHEGPEWEPLELWRDISRIARAMLLISRELNRRPPRPGNSSDWRALGIDGLAIPDQVEDAQFFLWSETNAWLETGRVGLRMETQGWSNRRTLWETEVHFGGDYNLLGAIALQLMLTIAGRDALSACRGCRLPFIPVRPRQTTYCDECGHERAAQDSDRRRKDRMIEARRLAAKGMSAEEIAEKLKVRSVASVHRWLKNKKGK